MGWEVESVNRSPANSDLPAHALTPSSYVMAALDAAIHSARPSAC